MNIPIESALVSLIPEAEDLVDAFRRCYDPSDAIGVPAHVTILYPFLPPAQLTPAVITTLRKLFLDVPGFTVSFADLQRFPDVLYLAPTPSGPFRELTALISGAFPDAPPYGGAFAEVIPHLTIAQVSDAGKLDQIALDFQQAARDRLPIRARVGTVSLMENSSGTWQFIERFSLRPTKT
jgi:2'-5' RNA ligase